MSRYGGHVLYVAIANHIDALAMHTGTLLWQRDLPYQDSETTGGAVNIQFDQGTIYVAHTDALENALLLYALGSQNGAVLWHQEVKPAVTDLSYLPVLASNGMVYVGTTNPDGVIGTLIALRGTDGHQVWSYRTDLISLAEANNVLYVFSGHPITAGDPGFHKDQKPLVALDATSGKSIWETTITNPGASPLALNDTLIVLQNGEHLCGYSRQNGVQVWCTHTTITGVPAASYQYVATNSALLATYLDGSASNEPCCTGVVEGINLQDGSTTWSYSIAHDWLLAGGLTLFGETMYTATTDRSPTSTLTALRVSDGHQSWLLHEQSHMVITALIADTW